MFAALLPERYSATADNRAVMAPTDSVLIVDDNEASRELLGLLLREAGFDVREAGDAEEALDALAYEPDLVILDVFLPERDGLAVCQHIKSDPATAGIPVIMVSGIAVDREDRVQSLETGADAFLTKPVDPDELVAHVRALLRARHAEDALRANERRLRAILEKSFDAVILIDECGAISYASPSSARILGYEPGNLDGNNAFDLLHPDDRRRVQGLFDRRLDTPEETVTVNCRGQHSDGSWRWLEVVCTNLLDEPGVAAIVCNFRDVTDHRRAEEALQKDAGILRAVLDSVTDGVVVCDARGDISLMNQAARELGGPVGGRASIAEWARQFMVYRPGGRSPLSAEERPLARVLRGEKVNAEEVVLAAGREDRLTMLASGQSLYDTRGDWSGAVLSLHDLTEQRRLEKQCHQSQKMETVGRLAGGVAHDFNNLLTVINGYTELLETALQADGPSRELLTQVRSAGERAATLTRQLLAFARPNEVTMRALDLNAVVADVEKMLRRVIGEDVDLIIDLQPGLAPIKADSGQLEQVLLNLAVNARDAMPHGGRLTITTQDVEPSQKPDATPARQVLLAVSDTGVGMSEEVRARLFEPFFTTKEDSLGTGLGLATVNGIIRQASGRIEVESAPGQGTTFSIFLPETTETVQPLSELRQRAPAHGTEAVLLVEDEGAVRSLAGRILRECGYTVLEARNGAEALTVCEEYSGPIHLLVSDVVMPGVGGRELAQKLHGLRPAIKTLFMSGYASEAVARFGVKEAEVNFLRKPFVPTQLARKVRKILDKA